MGSWKYQKVELENFWGFMFKFFVYEDTSLKLAIHTLCIMFLYKTFHDAFFQKFNIFWVIGARIVPESGVRKICDVAN